MTCNEIVPQITIDGITIEQISGKKDPLKEGYATYFSKEADEQFQLRISHTNIVRVNEFLGAFSLNDIKEATSGSPNLYSVKFLVTNDPEKQDLINEVVALSKQVAYYLYGDEANAEAYTQNPTPQEVKDFAKNPPKDAPQAAKDAVENLNKCMFKLAGVTTLPLIPNLAALSAIDISSIQTTSEKQKEEIATVIPVITLKDRIATAINDNNFNELDPIKDGIKSFVYPLNLDQDNPKFTGDPITLTLENSQEVMFNFSDTQLKNFFITVSPNVEYRENEQLIFSVRDFFSLPLVVNYAPQAISDKKSVEVILLEEKSGLDLEKLLANAALQQIKDSFGKKGYQTYMDNLKQQTFLSSPIVSVDYKGVVNGVFFLDQKKLAKNLTAYEAILEQEDIYKDVLKAVRIKKRYADETEKQLDTPNSYTGMEFQGGIVRGYHFVDQYEVKDFDYIIEVDAKNPLEKFLRYAVPELKLGKQGVDKLITSLQNNKGSLVILNPVSGYFTDDFYGSVAYVIANAVYNINRKALYDIYNYLLPGDPIKATDKKLSSISQLKDLTQRYDETIKTLLDLASTEGINVEEQASTDQKNKAKKQTKPYKTFTQKTAKPYKGTDARVYYDFLYGIEPITSDGFAIPPSSLLNRISTEESLLATFDTNTETTFSDEERLSITPVSIKIDDISTNLIANEEEIEQTTTKILLSAELEVKKPTLRYDAEEDVFAKLLETDGVAIVETTNKKLVELKEQDNFIPTDLKDSTGAKRGKKITTALDVLKAALEGLKKLAMQQLGQQTAKSLYLDEADYDPAIILFAAAAKSATLGGPAPDPKHGDIAKALGLAGYKENPSTYITRLMNSYQLEYLTGFDNQMSPIYAPVTKDFLNNFPEGFTVVVRMVLKAGIPVNEEYTILHQAFLLTNEATPLISPIFFNVIPNLSTIASIVSNLDITKLVITTPPNVSAVIEANAPQEQVLQAFVPETIIPTIPPKPKLLDSALNIKPFGKGLF